MLTPGAIPRLLRPRTFMAIGDSLIANGGGLYADLPYRRYNAASPVLWASMLSSARFQDLGAAATAGYTPAQILATHVPTVLAAKPGFCLVLSGQNGQTDFASVRTTHQTLFAAGITTIAATLPATGAGANLVKFNAFIARYARDQGIPLVDFHAATTDATTGLYKTGMDSGDGVHPSEAGAKAMGSALSTLMQQIVPQSSVAGLLADNAADAAVLLGNPTFATDSGFAAYAPTNWLPATSGTSAFDTEASTPGRRWGMTSTSASAFIYRTSQTLTVAPGDRVSFACKVGATVESVGGGWSLGVEDASFNTLLATPFYFTKDLPYGAVFANEIVIPSGVTSLKIEARTATANNAALQLGQVTLRNLTALGLP